MKKQKEIKQEESFWKKLCDSGLLGPLGALFSSMKDQEEFRKENKN